MTKNHNIFFNLAFNLAKINLGKTKKNPSVGCVVIKEDTVISSGYTSINGRPHAEFNALSKNIDFRGAEMYVTLEPCTHHGVTPPCTNIINRKKINKVFYSFNDLDSRTAKKTKKVLSKKKIKVIKKGINNFDDFYESYYVNRIKNLPFIDGKIAFSKDYFTINKKNKWITNSLSRKRVHLIRSRYDSILSTSKSINKDNSLLNCRLNGYDDKKPDLIIIDLFLRIKKNLKIFDSQHKRKVLIVTSIKNNKKIKYFKNKGIRFLFLDSLIVKNDFIYLFKKLNKLGFNRILVETGLKFLKTLLKNKLLNNLYQFKSSNKLGKNGSNNIPIKFLKKFKINKKIKVNLLGDRLYKVKLKNV